MADDDLQILTKALKVLIEMRHDWAKAIAAGYKRGETETAITKARCNLAGRDDRKAARTAAAKRSQRLASPVTSHPRRIAPTSRQVVES